MRVAVLLSGGVDSSVALHLARRQRPDAELTAFYLKIWLEDELSFLGDCPWEEDLRHAREVCAAAGVPLEVVSLQQQYHQLVVRDAIAELRAGRTPSPDVWCNERVKFGAFFSHLEGRDEPIDRVVSGHYARRAGEGGEEVRLYRAADPVKDQTYFLYRLNQRQLRRCWFPLGSYRKTEVRELARRFGLPNRDRPDSQGICFLGKIRYPEFVRSYLGERAGEIREAESDRLLGTHRGYWFHTIGQRKGLGLAGGPWYVVAKDIERNVVLVSHRRDLAQRSRSRFLLPEVHWIGRPPSTPSLTVKIRHTPTLVRCRLTAAPAGSGVEVRMEEEDPGIACGQSAVLYEGERCLGGGVIETVSASDRALAAQRSR